MKKISFISQKNDKVLNLVSQNGVSYAQASKILRAKDILVDGVRVKENVLVLAGSEVVFYTEQVAEQKFFDVVWQDDNVLVLDKKAGIEVEGRDGMEGLTGAIAVHRLDRNTEGLMIMAKNKAAEDELLRAFKEHRVEKRYLAEVVGPTNFSGEKYEAYLEKDAKESRVRIHDKSGRGRCKIVTIFNTIKSNPSSSLVECTLVTGKTHQIRAHLAYLGHPIIGDGKYGKNEDNRKFKQKRQQLKCTYLKLGALGNNLAYLSGKEFII